MNPIDEQNPQTHDAPYQQPTPPAPVETPPAPQPPVAPQPAGNTLAIIGLVLAIIANIVGLIISIIAFVKSKKAGRPSKIALAGIIVGAVTTVLGLVLTVALIATVVSRYIEVNEKCTALGTSSVTIDSVRHSCRGIVANSATTDNDSQESSEAKSIVGSDVEVVDGIVTSTCYTFKMPADYILSPNASQCQAELRMDNNTSSGIALTALFVKAQTGDSTLDDFNALMKKSGATTIESVMIDGIESGKAVVENSLGIQQTSYFVPDTTKSFKASNGDITSYLIYGPTGSEEVEAVLTTLVDSFKLR